VAWSVDRTASSTAIRTTATARRANLVHTVAPLRARNTSLPASSRTAAHTPRLHPRNPTVLRHKARARTATHPLHKDKAHMAMHHRRHKVNMVVTTRARRTQASKATVPNRMVLRTVAKGVMEGEDMIKARLRISLPMEDNNTAVLLKDSTRPTHRTISTHLHRREAATVSKAAREVMANKDKVDMGDKDMGSKVDKVNTHLLLTKAMVVAKDPMVVEVLHSQAGDLSELEEMRLYMT